MSKENVTKIEETKEIDEVVNEKFTPTNDYVFKRIFGKVGNENITREFLKVATGNEYKKIKLDDTPILDADVIKNKSGVIDVIVNAEDEEKVDIEMQIVKKKDIIDRMLWYWSKMYSSSIKEGEDYSKTKKIICVLIADFEVGELEDFKRFHTRWGINENKCHKKVLTDKFQLDIIELGKMGKGKRLTKEEKELMYWCKFIKTPEEVDSSIMEKYKEIKEAKEQLDEINADEHERYMAITRERALHDEASLRHDGYTEGLADGEKREKLSIAKKLLSKGMSIEEVSNITELTKEEIEKIELSK